MLFPGGLLRLSVGKPRSVRLIEDFLQGTKRPIPLTHPHQQHPHHYHNLPPYARGLIAVVALRPGSNDEAAAASASASSSSQQQGQQGQGGDGNNGALVGTRGERRWKVPEAAPFDVRVDMGVRGGELIWMVGVDQA